MPQRERRLRRLARAEELADEMEGLIAQLVDISNRLSQELRYDQPRTDP